MFTFKTTVKDRLTLATIMAVTAASAIIATRWVDNREVPLARDRFECEAVSHDVAHFNPKTRAFTWGSIPGGLPSPSPVPPVLVSTATTASDRDLLKTPSIILPPLPKK